MTTRIITADDEFFSLREAWNALHGEACGTVYQTFEWLSQWWKLYGPQFELRVLTGWEGSRLVGIFPCFIERYNLKFIHLSRLRFLGEYVVAGEYSPLVLPSSVDAFVSHAVTFCREEIRSGRCDFIDFQEYLSSAPFMEALLQGMRQWGFLLSALDKSRPRVVIELPDTWESYLSSLSYNERGLIRRHERALLKHGVEFETISNRSDISAFADLVALHTLLWTKRGTRGHFVNRDRFEEFHRVLATALLPAGVERLYFARCDGKRFVALQVFFFHGMCTAYLGGRDPDHRLSLYGPGKVLMSRVIKDAIAEGCKKFNFVRGDQEYKFRFGGRLDDWYGRATGTRWGFRGLKGILYVVLLKIRLALDRSTMGKKFTRVLVPWSREARRTRPEPSLQGAEDDSQE